MSRAFRMFSIDARKTHFFSAQQRKCFCVDRNSSRVCCVVVFLNYEMDLILSLHMIQFDGFFWHTTSGFFFFFATSQSFSLSLSFSRLLPFVVSLSLLALSPFVFIFCCLYFSFFLASRSSPKDLHLDQSNVFQWRSRACLRLVGRFAWGRALRFTLVRAAYTV